MKHGTRNMYCRGKCRCDECRAAESEYRASYNRGVRAAPRVVKHGSASTYTKGCRCDACRLAANAAAREWRKRPISERKITHGYGGYVSGCRCEICMTRHNEYAREHRRKKALELTPIALPVMFARIVRTVGAKSVKAKEAREIHRRNRYPFRTMEVGDSFFVPFAGRDPYKVGVMVCGAWRGEAPRKFTSVKEEYGIRCWRIE